MCILGSLTIQLLSAEYSFLHPLTLVLVPSSTHAELVCRSAFHRRYVFELFLFWI